MLAAGAGATPEAEPKTSREGPGEVDTTFSRSGRLPVRASPPFAARVSLSVCMRSLAWAGRGDHVAGKPEEARVPGTSSALSARRSGALRIPRRGLRGPAGNPGLSRRPGPEPRQVSPRLARVQVENMATSNLLKVSPWLQPGFCSATGALGSSGRSGLRVSGEVREWFGLVHRNGSRGGCCPSTPTPGPGLGVLPLAGRLTRSDAFQGPSQAGSESSAAGPHQPTMVTLGVRFF